MLSSLPLFTLTTAVLVDRSVPLVKLLVPRVAGLRHVNLALYLSLRLDVE